MTLVPFATFSLFHVLTFVRTTFLPKMPSSRDAAAGVPPPIGPGANVARTIQTWVKRHYEDAMAFVSYVEVLLVFPRLFFGAFLFRNSCAHISLVLAVS